MARKIKIEKIMNMSRLQWDSFKSGIVLVYGLALGKVYSLIVSQTHTSLEMAMMITLMLIIISMCFLIILNLNIFGNVEKLDNRHRFRIDFISAVESDSHDTVHEKARAFLERADLQHGCHIIAVNSYLEAASFVSCDNTVNIYANEYYKKLEELVQDGAEYSRIVQLPNGVTFSELINKTKNHYRNHFKNTIDMQRTAKQPVLLMSAKARFPLSFLLIKNQNNTNYLIWQIDEQTPGDANNPPQFQLHGIFLIEDPDRRIIGHFDWCFNQLLHTNTRIEPSEVVAEIVEAIEPTV